MVNLFYRLRFWLKNRKFKKAHPGQILFTPPTWSTDGDGCPEATFPEGWISLGYTDVDRFRNDR